MEELRKNLHSSDDGKELRNFMRIFLESRTTDNALQLISGLKTSNLWIPCVAVLSMRDEMRFLKGMHVGDTFINQDPIHCRPEILEKADGSLWFPVFSDPKEASSSYIQEKSFIPGKIQQVILMAESYGDLDGLVIDFQSIALEIPTYLWDVFMVDGFDQSK